MKPTAIVIEEAHGLIDKEILIQKVQTGQLFGYGFEADPASFEKYEGNIWATPSYGWATDSTMLFSTRKWVENMVSAAVGNFPCRVN